GWREISRHRSRRRGIDQSHSKTAEMKEMSNVRFGAQQKSCKIACCQAVIVFKLADDGLITHWNRRVAKSENVDFIDLVFVKPLAIGNRNSCRKRGENRDPVAAPNQFLGNTNS